MLFLPGVVDLEILFSITWPWEELKGQIYLGSEAFIQKHAAPNNLLKKFRAYS